MTDTIASEITATETVPVEQRRLDELPLTPFERFVLRNDLPRTPTVFRILIRVHGRFDKELFDEAYRIAHSRQLLLASHVQQVRGRQVWKRDPQPQSILWRNHISDERTIIESELEPIDLQKTVGLRTQIWPLDDGILILMDFHHACSDGQGTRTFLSEWFHIYHQLHSGSPLDLVPIEEERLLDRGFYRQTSEPVGLKEGLRNLYRTLRGRTVRLPRRRRSTDELNRISFNVERPLSIDQTASLRNRLKLNRRTMNDLGLAVTIHTVAELYPQASRRGYLTVLNPVDLRLPTDLKRPTCNRLGLAFIRRTHEEFKDFPVLLQGVHDEMQYIKRRYIGAEFLRGLDLTDKIPGFHNFAQMVGWFLPTAQFTCLGDTTRATRYRFHRVGDDLGAGELSLQRISGFGLLGARIPISIAACETNNRLSVTFRGSPDYLSQEETTRFADVFVEKLLSPAACDPSIV